jgi:type VI secretion system secreted protein Hcp
MALTDYHLKIDGVEGEDTHDKHKGEIAIESWSFEGQSGAYATGTGSGAGKVNVRDMRFTTHTNKATPKLILALCEGSHFKTAILTCRKAGGDQYDFLIITMTDVRVTSYQSGGSGGQITPLDSFSLNCATISVEYKSQGADGKVVPAGKMGYDLVAAKKL